MKVGVCLGDLSNTSGGAYTFQEEVFNSLMKIAKDSHHSFVIFCYSQEPDKLKQKIEGTGIQVVTSPSPSYFRKALTRIVGEIIAFLLMRRRLSRLAPIAKKLGVDFIWFVSNQVACIDIPYITVVWDLQHRLQPWFPEVSARGIWDIREKNYSWFLRRATAIIVGTETGKNEIMDFYQIPPSRVKILPHPTPIHNLLTTENKKDVLTKYNLPKDYIFYPAQFWPHKNHVNLLIGLKKLRDEYQLSIPAVFVGSDHGNKKFIRKFVDDLNLNKQIYFLGFVSQEELLDLYREALALTYLTFFGPENLPPLEAFFLGCPVIASDIAGAREQLGNCALLVDPKNPDDIASAIKLLHDNETIRKTLVRRGKDRSLKFTGPDYVKGVFKILDDFESIRNCWGFGDQVIE